jgi:hypothetical protein
MGSGGPRGLQILLSGASRVRGGFDSHTFPPSWLALALALACGGAPAWAEATPVAVDSVAADTFAVDRAAVGSQAESDPAGAGDSSPPVRPAPRRAAEEPAAARPFSTPRWVMLRSAALPGWGQAYNGQWFKAAAVAAAEVTLAYRIWDDNRILDDLERRVADAEAAGDDQLQNDLAVRFNDRLDTMVARQWLLAGVIAYALLDAYVDAHFRGFDIEFGVDPPTTGMRAVGPEARLGLKVAF